MRLYRQLQPSDPVPADGGARAVFAAIVESDALRLYLLEDGDGRVSASCYLNVIPNLTRGARPYAVIENVITDEARRGRGLGRAVIGHALDAAWAAGCYKVMLQTGSTQESTHAFYRACGFSGTDKHAYVAWCPDWPTP
ncbi:MAG: GNAT family N-acetyltransferase [Gammaproteobacteria bacterium]|nr:GNAT family N-acetyltransferase [Gammaproteobacteria bacterium]